MAAALRRLVMRHRRRLAAVGLLLTGVWWALPLPAAASTTGAGAFTATVILPYFPCAGCTGGSFTGSVALNLSGTGTSAVDGVPVPYVAAWGPPIPPATNASSPSFSYDETCAGGQPTDVVPLIGTAGGPFTVTGGTLTLATGTIGPATLSGTFSWVRDAAGAHLTFTGLTITAPQTTAINLNDAVLEGQGAAGFVWSTPAGSCAGAQQQNQRATVIGVALQPA